MKNQNENENENKNENENGKLITVQYSTVQRRKFVT